MKNRLVTTACLLPEFNLALATRHAGAAESLSPPQLKNNPVNWSSDLYTSTPVELQIPCQSGDHRHRANSRARRP